MFDGLRKLWSGARRTPAPLPVSLPTISRSEIAHLLSQHEGLPQVDWGAARAWVEHTDTERSQQNGRLRAIAAAWLDVLRDALPDDHRRWRRPHVEGLAPLADRTAERVASAVDRAYAVIGDALGSIREGTAIPPIAIVALATMDDYYSFIAPYYPDEGEFATSGGIYLGEQHSALPLICLPVQGSRSSIEEVIAHELTHHALAPMELPLWIEEGLTQLMEARMVGASPFALDADLLARHRRRWGRRGFGAFWSGEAFGSSRGDEQELAYHLAEFLARRELAQAPDRWFAFVRAASHDRGAEAAVTHLGLSLEKWAADAIGLST